MRRNHWVESLIFVAPLIAAIMVAMAIHTGGEMQSTCRHVVVAEFRNETGDTALDLLGSRIGHWITHRLQHAGIPTTNWDAALQSWWDVQNEIEAGRLNDPVCELASETGAEIVVSGTLLRGACECLKVRIDVTDVAKGESLGITFVPLQPGASEVEIITSVSRQAYASLAPTFATECDGFSPPRKVGAPPSAQAYHAYREGEKLLVEAEGVSDETVQFFRIAAELEPEWALPLIRLQAVARALPDG